MPHQQLPVREPAVGARQQRDAIDRRGLGQLDRAGYPE
jgi:hypothetical protein